MREYELTYLVSDVVEEADLKKITDKVAGFIGNEGGKVTKEESWGRRKLAYPILKQNFATYITVWFEMEAPKLADLDHELRVFPQVIRHLTTLKVEKSEVLKVTKEDIVGSSAVEEVLGEKSFEVVEGETEASKDLMAVREKDGDEEKEDDEKIEEMSDVAETENETTEEDEPEEKTEPRPEADQPMVEKKTRKAKITIKEPIAEPIVEEKAKKPVKAKKVEEPVSEEDEADRMKKLDEKLDELLGDDL